MPWVTIKTGRPIPEPTDSAAWRLLPRDREPETLGRVLGDLAPAR
jgi:hypothetical protein